MAPNHPRQVIAVDDPAALARTAAERVLARIAANSARVAVCLTGGSSPTKLYRLLATDPYRSQIPWPRVHWFIGDVRLFPPNDPLKNSGMAQRTVLDPCDPVANNPTCTPVTA